MPRPVRFDALLFVGLLVGCDLVSAAKTPETQPGAEETGSGEGGGDGADGTDGGEDGGTDGGSTETGETGGPTPAKNQRRDCYLGPRWAMER